MNSCVGSGLIGEAENWQMSGYMHGPNKEKQQVLPEDSNGQVTELLQGLVT
jgi:hypothetical protein